MPRIRVPSADRLAGILIVAGLIAGMAAVNSPLRPLYETVHHATVHLGIGGLTFAEPLIGWINDGLMVFFFLLVGMQIKRELLEGHLSTLRKAALPAYAAAGGMLVPALIYLAATSGDPVSARGWAIPTATDIVLAISVLGLLGRRVPPALRTFLLAVAIFDDIGAVLILGLFYGSGLTPVPFAIAVAALAVLWLLNRASVMRAWPYVAVGAMLWAAMLGSGIEPALAGALTGLAIPLRPADTAPLPRLERRLEPWVSFLVVPLFAFFNAGVPVDGDALGGLGAPFALGIILGLLLGKPIGILAASWIAVRLGAGQLPAGIGWAQVGGAAVIGGIGFTLSQFVAALAFADLPILATAKLAILAGSLLSAAAGLLILHRVARRGMAPGRPAHGRRRGDRA